MAERDILTGHQIQDYVDGRLHERDQATVAAYLLAHPRAAADVETLRRQNEALKGIGQNILTEPVPERLRDVLRQRNVVSMRGRRRPRLSGFLEAAAAIVLFCVGGALGWYAHEGLTPRIGLEDLIASNAADVYAFYGGEQSYPLDFPPDRTAELVSWIDRSFNRKIAPPDLADLSYKYRGGRLLPISGASTGFFQFEGPAGERLAVVFWAGNEVPTQLAEMGRKKNVAARYWLDDGFNFAVMSDETNPDLESAAKAVFAYYDGAFGTQ